MIHHHKKTKDGTISEKRKGKTKVILCLACAATISGFGRVDVPGVPALSFVASAAESSVIESLSVSFETKWGDAEEIPEPVIKVSGSGVFLGDYQFRTEYDDWKPGKKVRVEVNVVAEAGKYFPESFGSSKCRVSGAEFVSAKALDDNTLQVKIDYTPVTVLGTTEKAGWSSSSSKKAVWKKVEYAPGYTLTLYGNDKVVKRMTVTGNSVSLGEYMTDSDKIYYYEVKAVPVTSPQKKYLKEGEFVTSTDQRLDESEASHGSQSSGNSHSGRGDSGSFKGDHYVSPDGSLAVNTWKKIGGNWYYFGADGNRSRGWLNYGGRWYYMDGNGVMQTGWLQTGGSWFYLGPDGDMFTGWIQPRSGDWYYMNPDGRMQTGWLFENGSWYYLDGSGRMATGWAQPAPGNWYYMDGSGRMQTGWLSYNGSWYYLNRDGSMAVNTVVDGWSIGPDGIGRRG